MTQLHFGEALAGKSRRSAAADEFYVGYFLFFKKKKVTIKSEKKLKVVRDYEEHRPTKSGGFVEQNQIIFEHLWNTHRNIEIE